MFLEIWISASKKLMPNADFFYLEKMTLVMTSLPLAHVFYVCLHVSFPLHNDWQKSDSSVDRYPQANWRWNSNSRDLVASSPSSPLPTARVHSLWWTLRVCSFKMMQIRIVGHLDHGTLIELINPLWFLWCTMIWSIPDPRSLILLWIIPMECSLRRCQAQTCPERKKERLKVGKEKKNTNKRFGCGLLFQLQSS